MELSPMNQREREKGGQVLVLSTKCLKLLSWPQTLFNVVKTTRKVKKMFRTANIKKMQLSKVLNTKKFFSNIIVPFNKRKKNQQTNEIDFLFDSKLLCCPFFVLDFFLIHQNKKKDQNKRNVIGNVVQC